MRSSHTDIDMAELVILYCTCSATKHFKPASNAELTAAVEGCVKEFKNQQIHGGKNYLAIDTILVCVHICAVYALFSSQQSSHQELDGTSKLPSKHVWQYRQSEIAPQVPTVRSESGTCPK